jgi:type IV secretory pathway VirB3-like protein
MEIKKGGKKKMQWELIVALVVAIPIVLFPAAYVWYLNIGGIVHVVREAKAAKEKKAAEVKITS